VNQSDEIKEPKSILDDSIAEHKSRPPLRWIANWAGSIASSGLLEISYLEDEGKTDTFRYKFHAWKWDTFWPLYREYGTAYRLRMDLSGKEWDDYDENGVPYWEKWELWDYEDEETGDAFRIIKK
jgi:hypothetical protein